MFNDLRSLDPTRRREVIGKRVEDISKLLDPAIIGDDGTGQSLVEGVRSQSGVYVTNVALHVAEDKRGELIRGNSFDEKKHMDRLTALEKIRKGSHIALIDTINPLQRYLAKYKPQIEAAGKKILHGGILPIDTSIRLYEGVIFVRYEVLDERLAIGGWAGDLVLYQNDQKPSRLNI